jgi:predicted dehydrogenase
MMKVGIAGSGSIVPEFLRTAKLVGELEVVAICGTERSRERLWKLADEYAISNVYTDFDMMLVNSGIETVYIALPNHLHFSFARLALLAGKNVIIEKPFASNLKEAQNLAELAEEKGLLLFEAISNQYLPNYKKVRELLPRLGDIKIVELNFSQYSSRYDAFKRGEELPVFSPEMSGGALMDINVYNIHFILGLFGRPGKIHYHANIEREIDTSGILFLDYGNFKCSAIGAKDCRAKSYISIQGTDGFIYSDTTTNEFSGFVFGKTYESAETICVNTHRERLYDELKAFSVMIQQRDIKGCTRMLAQTLEVMRILHEAREQAGIKIVR